MIKEKMRKEKMGMKEVKNDNYGPRRNGVKNSWGLKLHYFLVGSKWS